MRTTISDVDLRRLASDAGGPCGRALMAATRAKPNGEVKEFEDEIKQFERVFRMSSTEMRSRLHSGSLNETLEITRWILLLDLRDRVQARPR